VQLTVEAEARLAVDLNSRITASWDVEILDGLPSPMPCRHHFTTDDSRRFMQTTFDDGLDRVDPRLFVEFHQETLLDCLICLWLVFITLRLYCNVDSTSDPSVHVGSQLLTRQVCSWKYSCQVYCSLVHWQCVSFEHPASCFAFLS
jgi:hypothetical protein